MNASDPHDQIVPEVTQPKHTKFGIGSFVISILNGTLILILTITASVMDENGVIIHVIQKPKTKDHANEILGLLNLK